MSADMPVTPGLQTYPVGTSAGFVISMDPVGTIRFLRYLGGDKPLVFGITEGLNAIAVDAQSNIYLAGYTEAFWSPLGSGGDFHFKPSSNPPQCLDLWYRSISNSTPGGARTGDRRAEILLSVR
jgi:hypothetical protein